MATSTIPASNPAGNNQTSPTAMIGGVNKPPQPMVASTQDNSFIPPGSVVPSSTAAPAPVTTGGYSTNVQPIVPGGVASNNLQTQLTDIYGQGVGASLFNLLDNESGTDSTALQEYINSLAPQEATASANLKASLGASGVGANSSVAALSEANLQAQEFADISGESANITLSQEQQEAQILESMTGAATKEVSSSGWDVFGQAVGAAGNLFSDVFDPVKIGK